MPIPDPYTLRRRTLLLATTAAAATVAVPAIAQAQAFPSRPITLIVPWPAGGPTDRHLRVLAEVASTHLGQNVLISNQPGAGGSLGPATMAATAKPDGYTIAQFSHNMTIIPNMHRVAWHPVDDFTHIIGLSGYTVGFAVRADSPFKTFQEFIEAARKQPGRINFGNTGGPNILMRQVTDQAKVELTPVPFAGGAPLLTALLGGHVMSMLDTVGIWGHLVDAGQIRLLATFGTERTKHWPQVPTVIELGYAGVDFIAPYGLAGPKGMDPAVVKILHDAFKKSLDDPRHLVVLEQLRQIVWYLDSAAYRQFVITSFADDRALIEQLGLLRADLQRPN